MLQVVALRGLACPLYGLAGHTRFTVEVRRSRSCCRNTKRSGKGTYRDHGQQRDGRGRRPAAAPWESVGLGWPGVHPVRAISSALLRRRLTQGGAGKGGGRASASPSEENRLELEKRLPLPALLDALIKAIMSLSAAMSAARFVNTGHMLARLQSSVLCTVNQRSQPAFSILRPVSSLAPCLPRDEP